MLAKLLIGDSSTFWKLRSKYKEKNDIRRKIVQALAAWYLYENNSSIDQDTEIANEPCFPHGIKGIFISGAAKIGKNCIIFQQVTIGSITLHDAKTVGAPTLGDNVYIGAGAKIIGNVVVGNNVRIGANSVVYKDIPDNSTVVAAGQVVVTKEIDMINKYYSFDSKNNNWIFFQNGIWNIELDSNITSKLSSSQSK